MRLVVSIFGPDGSGKSTQARILANYLTNQGFTVNIVWIKSYHTLAYVFSKIFEKLSPRSVVLNAYGHVIRIKPISLCRFNRLLWAWIELVSVIPVVLFRAYLPMLIGKTIITERFLVDSVVSISYALNNPNFGKDFVGRVMLKLIPKNSILIYLNSSYEEVKNRRGCLAECEEFFTFQQRVYEKLSSMLGAYRIDNTGLSIEETATVIRGIVLKKLPRVG